MPRRPIDAVTTSIIKLQRSQRAVDAFIAEVIDRVSADPTAASSQPEMRLRLSELRARVDEAVDQLSAALEQMGEASSH